MSNLSKLSAVERNIVIVAARTQQNFLEVSRILSIRNPEEAQEIFERARRKLVHEAYGAPDEGWLTIGAMAKTLGVTHSWVSRAVQRFENLAVQRDAGNGMIVPHFPPQVLQALKTVRRESYTKQSEGWQSAKQMERLTGASWRWVAQRLDPYKHLAVRQKNSAGQSQLHYPPDVFDAIRSMREAEMAHPEVGDYLNLNELREQLGKSRAWIQNTLTSFGFVAEPRRERMGRVIGYYPPLALEVLSKAASEFPPSGKWITLHRISVKLQKDRGWVESRIKESGFVGEIRCQPGYGKPTMHYPPEVLARLKPLARQHPRAGEWLTANALEELTQTSANWVTRRLKELAPLNEVRLDEHGVARLHYPREILDTMLILKADLNRLQGRHTAGLRFRITVLKALASSESAMTVPEIRSILTEGQNDKKVYDALLWLKQRGHVSSVKVTSERKARWQITESGRRAIPDEEFVNA